MKGSTLRFLLEFECMTQGGDRKVVRILFRKCEADDRKRQSSWKWQNSVFSLSDVLDEDRTMCVVILVLEL